MAAIGVGYAVSVLELRNIIKHFGAIHVLNDVDLHIGPGEVLGLMGDNGAGKSTLVRVMAGHFPPTSGEVLIDASSVIVEASDEDHA